MKNKKKIFILLIGLFIMSLIIMTTYAYFSAIINGNSSSNNVNISMKNMTLTFSDKTGLVTAEGVEPGWTYEKTVTVEYNGDDDVTYDLVWLSLENEILNDEMTYTIECTSNCNGLENTSVTSGTGENLKIVTNTISKDEVQTYKITFEFKELNGANQNYNEGKIFTGNIGILQTGTYTEKYIGKINTD